MSEPMVTIRLPADQLDAYIGAMVETIGLAWQCVSDRCVEGPERQECEQWIERAEVILELLKAARDGDSGDMAGERAGQ